MGSPTDVASTPVRLSALRAWTALGFWILNVALHHDAQELFAYWAGSYGFERLQAVELQIFAPLLVLGVAGLAWRAGWRLASIVLLANLVAAANFVTRAEALHLVQYAAVCFLWARVLRPRQAFYLTVLLGTVDEALQWAWLDTVRAGAFVDVKDCALNVVGALNGWALVVAVRGTRGTRATSPG